MYEGKINRAGIMPPLDLPEAGQDDLRAVKWSDLVAKFDAARGLRAELGAGEADGDASFDPDSARHIAALAGGKQAVNFDNLANGKTTGGNSRSAIGAVSDDPRT
jgi:hypothetical protein